MRVACLVLACGWMAVFLAAAGPHNDPPALGQTSSKPMAPPPAPTGQEPSIFTFRAGVTEVMVPVTVIGKGGDYVVDLKPADFKLYDNDTKQAIQVQLTEMPISLVILVNNSDRIESLLPEVRKLGVLFTTLLLGEQGEAAILTYDHLVLVKQDFTHNAGQLEKALADIKLGSSQARLSDAMVRALGMLARRPDGRRKVIVAIGEDRNYGSETPLGYALREAQLGGVLVYAVGLSRLKSALSTQPAPPPPPQFPPGAIPMPPGVPPTPENQRQAGGQVNLGAAIAAVASGVNDLFRSQPMEAYAKGTGAVRVTAGNKKAIDEAIARISNELHSQYLITYRPANLEGGYHNIRVEVNRPVDEVRTRPGYFFPGATAAEATDQTTPARPQ